MMVQRILFLFSALCTFVLLIQFPAFSETPAQTQNPPGAIGIILQIEGDGLITHASDSSKIAKPDDPVYIDDTLQTGPGGRMFVLLLDDTRFTLGENSQLKIGPYVYDDKNDIHNMARYDVPKGTFMYVSGLIAKKEKPDVKITASYGTISIRGTTVWGGLLDDGYGVYVSDGEAIIESKRGRIRVGKGEGTTIHNINAIPKRAGIWNAERVDWIKKTVALKNPDISQKYLDKNKENWQTLIIAHKQMMLKKDLMKDASQASGNGVREIRLTHQKQAPVAEADAPKEAKKEEKKEAVPTVVPEESNVAPPVLPEKKTQEGPL